MLTDITQKQKRSAEVDVHMLREKKRQKLSKPKI
jgi:hypothetical protein